MTNSTSSKILRTALFTLVPLAWFSFWFWQPFSLHFLSRYSPALQWLCVTLMALVLLASWMSWRRRQYRLLSAFGFLVCFVWLIMSMLPVI